MKPPLPTPTIGTKFNTFQTHDLGGGYVTTNIDTDVKPNQLTGGQNIDINGNSPEKRKGHTIYGSVSGFTTQILGSIAHEPPSGVNELLRVYDTVIERYVSGTWTALTGVTMTTNLPTNYTYFSSLSKTYVLNGTDNVVKYASGAAGDQTDAVFKKGKYVVEYKNRLIVAGISGQENYVWYTDLNVDTFGANNYFPVKGVITGVKVLYDKLIILTKNTVYTVSNFDFNGATVAPTALIPLRGDIGCIAHRTWQVVGNLAYFLGLSANGIAAVYATDGTTIGNEPVSTPIDSDFTSLAPAQLTNACAGTWGRYYRISVTPTGQTSNTYEYTYDVIGHRWSPPYTNTVGGFSSYVPFTVNGQKYLFAGSQTSGMTYQLSQTDYDEQLSTSFVTGQDTNGAIDGNPAKRIAQSFKIPAGQSSSYLVTGVMLYLKKNAGTTTDLTIRIETDTAGVPSGTLANANLTGTITAFSTATYGWYFVKFTTPSLLTTSTTYWIVAKHTTEGSGTSQYFWGYKAAGTYTQGNLATYATGSWTAVGAADALFGLTIEGDYDAWADTAALYITPIGQRYHLRDLFIDAKAAGSYNIQVGVNTGDYKSFSYQDLDTSSSGPLFGSTLIIGQSILGGKLRSEQRLRWDSIRGYTLKLRFRNRFANQPFKIYGLRTRHEVLPKVK